MLKAIGYNPYKIHQPNIDEKILYKESPKNYVSRLSEEKARSAISLQNNSYILGADTAIFCGAQIIGKPKNYDDAYNILNNLSGKRHRVFGGICLISPNQKVIKRVIVTRVKFRFISEKEILDYLITNEWKDKAGGYAIQGYAAKFVKHISGNYDNVKGLSLVDFDSMMRGIN